MNKHQSQLETVKKRYRSLVRAGVTPLNAAYTALEEVPDSFGVESIPAKHSSTEVLFANTGEAYQSTILAFHSLNGRVSFRIGTWGDLVESGRYGS